MVVGIDLLWRLGKALIGSSIGVVLIWYVFGIDMAYVWLWHRYGIGLVFGVVLA